MKTYWLAIIIGLFVIVTISCNQGTSNESDTGTPLSDSNMETGTETSSDSSSETETESETDTFMQLECSNLTSCELPDTEDIHSNFSCPVVDGITRHCIRIHACGGYDSTLCATEEEACAVQCGTKSCGFLDSDPMIVTCDE